MWNLTRGSDMDNNVKAFVEMLPGLTDDNLLKLLGIMHAVRDGVVYNTNDPSAKQVKIAKRAGKVDRKSVV